MPACSQGSSLALVGLPGNRATSVPEKEPADGLGDAKTAFVLKSNPSFCSSPGLALWEQTPYQRLLGFVYSTLTTTEVSVAAALLTVFFYECF